MSKRVGHIIFIYNVSSFIKIAFKGQTIPIKNESVHTKGAVGIVV